MGCRYAFGGDEHIFVEVDEAMSLEAFFVSLSMTNAVRESNIKGVTEICPANASFQIKFNPDDIHPNDLLAELKRLEATADQAEPVLNTRIIEIPVYYQDPWTHETLMRFRERHQDPNTFLPPESYHPHCIERRWVDLLHEGVLGEIFLNDEIAAVLSIEISQRARTGVRGRGRARSGFAQRRGPRRRCRRPTTSRPATVQ